MVILQGETACGAVSQLSDSIRIISLHVSVEGNNEATISMLRPLRNHAIDLPCTRSAAQQLAHQMRVRWSLMSSFEMIHVRELDGLSQENVSQLGKGTWTHLKYLRLTDCDLDAKAFSLLSQLAIPQESGHIWYLPGC